MRHWHIFYLGTVNNKIYIKLIFTIEKLIENLSMELMTNEIETIYIFNIFKTNDSIYNMYSQINKKIFLEYWNNII